MKKEKIKKYLHKLGYSVDRLNGEWHPKIDFSEERGVEAAAEILRGEGFDAHWTFHPSKTSGGHIYCLYPTILLRGSRKDAMAVFYFSKYNEWPVRGINKRWYGQDLEKGNFKKCHWEIGFKVTSSRWKMQIRYLQHDGTWLPE